MSRQIQKTKVIFRKFPEGDIIAIFPEELGTVDLDTCWSYQTVGQHGTCDIDLIGTLEIATSEEYQDLKAELESIGYVLDVYAYCNYESAKYSRLKKLLAMAK